MLALPSDARLLSPTPGHDVREVGRVVATVLLATGTPSPAALALANQGLARLGRAALIDRDLVVTTPEELAPQIPPELRAPSPICSSS